MPETIQFIDANPSTGFTQDHFRHPYDLHGIAIDYPLVTGHLQVPVASEDPEAESEIVTVVAPFSQKRVRWAARRIGEQPVIPDPTPISENEVLVFSVVTPQAPTLEPDGASRVYTIAGEYRYAVRKPRRASDPIPMGKVAYDAAAKEGNVIDQTHISRDLI